MPAKSHWRTAPAKPKRRPIQTPPQKFGKICILENMRNKWHGKRKWHEEPETDWTRLAIAAIIAILFLELFIPNMFEIGNFIVRHIFTPLPGTK
jgi:hypothetical protein